MKIIERGVPASSFAFVGLFQCTECRSKIELEPDDALGALESIDNYQGVSVRIHCPVCEDLRWLQKVQQ